MKQAAAADISISALEKELGIGKDTLRVWERRYGFPQPTRDARGERRYPAEQVDRLRVMRRLLDRGMRPHQVIGLPAEALQAYSDAPVKSAMQAPPMHAELYGLLRSHDALALQRALRTILVREGLERFVLDTAGILVEAVGDWWAAGTLEVFEEHLFTEQLGRVLREAVSQVPARNARPHVLLTTLPDEPHALGLLLAEAVMRLEGARCTSLGVQTPEGQILAAVRAGGMDIVALSFSSYFGLPQMREAVTRLRAALPARVGLWCGGAAAERLKKTPIGVQRISRLAAIGPNLAQWREALRESSGSRGK